MCDDDQTTWNFLKEILFSEADKVKYSRYREEYLEAIKKCAIEWRDDVENQDS